jgi:hypothetical protein
MIMTANTQAQAVQAPVQEVPQGFFRRTWKAWACGAAVGLVGAGAASAGYYVGKKKGFLEGLIEAEGKFEMFKDASN